MLTAVFLDEWNLFLNMKLTVTPTFKFKMFGSEYLLTIEDLVKANLNILMSIGGKFNNNSGRLTQT